MAVIEVTVSGTTVVVDDKDTVLINIPGGGTVTIVANDDEVKDFDIDYGGDDNVSDEVFVDLGTFAKDKLHIDIENYDTSDCIHLNGGMNLTPDPKKEDHLDFDYIGSDGKEYSGFVHAKDGDADWSGDDPIICICLTPGSLVATVSGEVPVEDLKVGDLVITADNGIQPIRWIGRKYISGARMHANPNIRPIRIRQDAFGENVPERDMWVSPQHRMMLNSFRADMLYGENEVLVPAKGLINDHSVTVDYKIRSVEYFHILFDQHELIFADGAVTESFHPGLAALGGIEDDARQEIFQIFPELEQNTRSFGPAARLSLRPGELRGLFS